MKTELTLEEIRKDCSDLDNKILDLYLERKTQKIICELLKVTTGKIDYLVKKYNLTRFRSRNLYTLEESVISLDNPDFCYFLGFYAADGNLHKTNSGSEIVQFTIKDKEILIHIKNILKYTGEIKVYEKQEKIYYYLGITNNFLSTFLKNIIGGFRKTSIIQFPEFLNLDCEAMFLRGFIDGDGSYSKTKYDGKYVFKMYCDNVEFLSKFIRSMKKLTGELDVCIYDEGKTIELVNQSQLVSFFKVIYKYNPNLSLSRKLNRAIQHIEYVSKEKVDDIVRYFNEN